MKRMKIVEIALLVISVVVFIIAFVGIKNIDSPMLNMYLGWVYILMACALIATLAFPLANAFKNKKSLIKLLVLIAAVVVIFGGAYLIAPGSPVEMNNEVPVSQFKFADTALYIVYLFVVAAFVALLWSGIRKAIKK